MDEISTKGYHKPLANALRSNNTFDTSIIAMLSQDFCTECILHEAIHAGVLDNVLMLLVKQYPIFLTQVDHNGRYPVHVACAFGSSSEFVSHCIDLAPKSAASKDIDGKTPIHLICQGTWRGCWDAKFNTAAEKNIKEILWVLDLRAPLSFLSEYCQGVGCIEYTI